MRVRLTVWSEIVGLLRKVSYENGKVLAELDGMVLELPGDAFPRKRLESLIGRRIAVLRTDIPEKRFLIRTVRSA